MASIATSINLYDRVSAPINNIISALDNMCSAYENVDNSMDSGLNIARIEEARQAINAASQEVTNLGNNIENNEKHQQHFNNAVNQGQSAMAGLVTKALSLAGAYIGVTKLVEMSDKITTITARVNMMNDSFNKVNGSAVKSNEIVDMIYESAQNARGSFYDMADIVSRFGNNARDAFGSQKEVVDFANLIQKQMVLAGAGTQEASNAMLQLSQALGSGVLRGDELNSIFEQAPNLIQSIADYMDVPIGSIRELAQQGKLSADVVKNAIFASADSINAEFKKMPLTWAQVWTMMGNAATRALQPVLARISELANTEKFQVFATNAVNALSVLANMIITIMDLAVDAANFIADNWAIIEPIILGAAAAMGIYATALLIGKGIMFVMAVAQGIHTAITSAWSVATFAATASQYGLNAALLACPITWILLIIIAIIAAIIAVASAIAKMTGIADSGLGVITGGLNVVIQFFVNLGLTVANIALGIWNALNALCSNMTTAFHNAICSVQSWFYNLLSTALSVIAGIAQALNKLPFVEFDYSGISNAANDYAQKASKAAGNKREYKDVGAAFNKGMSTHDTFKDGWAKNAFDKGAAFGDGLSGKISGAVDGIMNPKGGLGKSNMFDGSGYKTGNYTSTGKTPEEIADSSNLENIANNTGRAADSLSVSSEELKYLRDIAQREAINRFTTAEIKIDMTNNNNINSSMDIDGIVDELDEKLNTAMENAALGVYS